MARTSSDISNYPDVLSGRTLGRRIGSTEWRAAKRLHGEENATQPEIKTLPGHACRQLKIAVVAAPVRRDLVPSSTTRAAKVRQKNYGIEHAMLCLPVPCG